MRTAPQSVNHHQLPESAPWPGWRRLRGAAARAWLVFLGLLLTLVVSGCRREMYNQPLFKPLDRSTFFSDGMSARPLVHGTVARGYLRTNDALYRGMSGTNLVRDIPLPVNLDLLKRGQERYQIYCSVCHGADGEGNGMIVQRGFPRPPSYHIDRLRQAPAGHFYRVITDGYGVMYPYAARVKPEDRWAITAYIRALQLSRHVPVQALPPALRAELKEPNQ